MTDNTLQQAEARLRTQPITLANGAQAMADIMKCAQAWLEERDETVMTCQRLVDLGFLESKSYWGHRYFSLGELRIRQNIVDGTPVGWDLLWCGCLSSSKCPETIGDVRRLCRALGLTITERN